MMRRLFFSLAGRLSHLRSTFRSFYYSLHPNISVGSGTLVARGAELSATDGGKIEFGRNVWIGRNTRLVARKGRIVVGDNSHIGDGVIIAASELIKIGHDTLIAEYVVIRDQEHVIAAAGPKRLAGERTARVVIGDDVWIGAKASILMGSHIGAASVIGAHALVRGQIPGFVLAVGVPARVVKTLDLREIQSQHRQASN
jgi:acetyltransferase-like isoleucine patch superfamily enzyme